VLSVLTDDASKMGWRVNIQVVPDHFTSPAKMANLLGVEYKSLYTRSAHVDEKVYRDTWQSERENVSLVADVIGEAAQSKPLLLILDEAQRLQTLSDIPEDKKSAEAVFESILNGKIGYPVMFLTGGLSTSRKALAALGISRITNSNRIRVGILDQEHAKAVIVDYVHGEFDREVLANWVETLVARSQGCHSTLSATLTQPVMYLQHAPSDSDLQDALMEGHRAQVDYYNDRAHDITYGQREALASVFAEISIGGAVRKREVVNTLCKEYPMEVAEAKFKQELSIKAS